MNTVNYTKVIVSELEQTLAKVSADELDQLVNAVLRAEKVFVAGAGRSGFMAKSFAMRLMHMGVQAFVVGETITPGIGKADLLIAGSGSGTTKSLIAMAEKAKSLEAICAAITINADSKLANLCDITVQIPAKPKDSESTEYQSIQPMGSLFEQSLLLVYDAVILALMDKKELNGQTMYGQHANLE